MDRIRLFLSFLCLQAVIGSRLKISSVPGPIRPHSPSSSVALRHTVTSSQNIDLALLQRRPVWDNEENLGSETMMPIPASFLDRSQSELKAESLVLPPELAKLATVVRFLGSGSFGKVWLLEATCTKESEAYVAVKVMSLQGESKKHVALLRNEAKVMKLMSGSSEYVVSLVGQEVELDEKIYLMMPYQNAGELFPVYRDMMHNPSNLQPPFDDKHLIVAFWFQAVMGVEALHGRGIVHMDLKPDNLMLNCRPHDGKNRKCHAMVIDLGLACASPQHREIVLESFPCRDGMGKVICIRFIDDRIRQLMRERNADEAFFNQKTFITIRNSDHRIFGNLAERLLDKGQYPLTIVYHEYPAPCNLRGTPGYISPEAYRANSDQSTKMLVSHPMNDIWALGTMLYSIFTLHQVPWMKVGSVAFRNALKKVQEECAYEKSCIELRMPEVERKSNLDELQALLDYDVDNDPVLDAFNDEFPKMTYLIRKTLKQRFDINATLLETLLTQDQDPADQRFATGEILESMEEVMTEIGGEDYIEMINNKPSDMGAMYVPPACLEDGENLLDESEDLIAG